MNIQGLPRCVVLALLLAPASLCAQEPSKTDTAQPGAEAAARPALSDTQQAIKVRFDRFEDTLFKMARYLQKTEPARAELVLRALSRSKEERVAERMTLISRMLSKEEAGAPRFADALEEQDAILANIRELLTILRSEDILDENRKEQERLKELARQVAALIDAEKVHQADTQRGTPTDRVAKGQEKTAQRTGGIVEKIDEHDRAGAANKSDKNSKDGEPKKGEPKEGEQNKDEPKDSAKAKDGAKGEDSPKDDNNSKGSDSKAKPSDENGKNSDKPKAGDEQADGKEGSKSDKNSDAEPQDGKQGSKSKSPKDGQQAQPSKSGQQGEQSDSSEESQQDSQQSTPGRQELEAARDKMERAIEELKKENRENASKEQEEAIRKLIEAKERIEELLRQLREEERELLLRSLEARFQKMLQLQEAVLVTTERLEAISNDKWSDREFSLCRDAASTEREIVIEAEKSLEVLRADGSSVAFPEAVEQITTDVGEVANRLGREDAGELTVAIEREVIDALKEMIQAFQKEMEKLRQKKGQPGGQQGGAPSEPGLVDKLAELKMLKTLQLRINRRTKTLGKMIEGEQATEPDVVKQLRELSQRQSRLQRATYDLAAGKTAN